MEREIVKEVEVSAAASEVWKIYGSLELSKLSCELSSMVEKFEVLEGDGGVGTITQVWTIVGNSSFKEKIIKIDNEKRLKETELLKGESRNEWSSLTRMRFEILEKEANSCIVKITVESNVDSKDGVTMAKLQSQSLVSFAAAIGRRICEKEN